MSHVLEGLDKFTVAYLDDIIFSNTLKDHLVHIQTVFYRLREHSLKLKLKKCSFLKAETIYLDFIVNEHGGGGRVVRWCWVNFQCRGVLQF